MKIEKIWTPRWYYVMQNRTSGLIYVGQSSKVNLDKYCGSGQYWKPHCKKHGGYNRSNIEVIEQSWFDSEDDAKLWLKMLEDDCGQYWLSDSYANQIPENTLDNPFYSAEFQNSDKMKLTREKANQTNKKNGTGLYNQNHRMKGSIKGIETHKRNKTGVYDPKVIEKGHETNKKNKTGFYNSDVQKRASKKSHEINKIRRTGIYDLKVQKRRIITQKINKVGIYDPKVNKKALEKAKKVRFKCGQCDMITNPGCMGMHQKATGHLGKTKIVLET